MLALGRRVSNSFLLPSRRPWRPEPGKMTRKTLWQVSVTVPAEAEEAALDLLSCHLAAGASGYRAADAPQATVSVYSPTPPVSGVLEALHQSLRQLEHSELTARQDQIKVRRIRQENWAQSWKRHFKPLVIGRRLLVRPTWSRRRAGTGQHVVVLDPGLSFGTGHHPTTWFCLRQVVASRARDGAASFLDWAPGPGSWQSLPPSSATVASMRLTMTRSDPHGQAQRAKKSGGIQDPPAPPRLAIVAPAGGEDLRLGLCQLDQRPADRTSAANCGTGQPSWGVGTGRGPPARIRFCDSSLR